MSDIYWDSVSFMVTLNVATVLFLKNLATFTLVVQTLKCTVMHIRVSDYIFSFNKISLVI